MLCAFRTRKSVTSSSRRTSSSGWVTVRACQPSPRDLISDILRFSSDLGAYFQSASKSRKAGTLWLHILQQNKKSNRSWKLQRQLFFRAKGWARRTQTSWTQFTAFLQASCQGWDKSVKCCGLVPQLQNRVISSFLPRTLSVSLSHARCLSNAAFATKTLLHESAWMGSPGTYTCGWSNYHQKTAGEKWKHMCHEIARESLPKTGKLKTPRGWWMCPSTRGGLTQTMPREEMGCYTQTETRGITHLLTQGPSKELLNTCLETMVVSGWPTASE